LNKLKIPIEGGQCHLRVGTSRRNSREEEEVKVVKEHKGHHALKEEVEEIIQEIGEEMGASLHWREVLGDIQQCLCGFQFNGRLCGCQFSPR